MKIQYGKSLEALLYGYNFLFKTEYTMSDSNEKILKKLIAECAKLFYGEIETANENTCLAVVSNIFFLIGKNSSSIDFNKSKHIYSFILQIVRTQDADKENIEDQLLNIKKVPTFFALHSIISSQDAMYDVIKHTSNTLFNKVNAIERSHVLQSSSLNDYEYKDLCSNIDFLFITNPYSTFQNKKEFEKICSLLSLRKTANKFTYLMLLEDEKYDLAYLFENVYQYYRQFDSNNYMYDTLLRTIGSFNER